MARQVVTRHPIVDDILSQYADQLGADADTYRNHVLRCLNYHTLLRGTAVADEVAVAWAVHDLGIWTAGTFDYLEPSAELGQDYARQHGIAGTEQVRALVVDHHRLRGLPDPEAEAFRRADLIDVSRGLLRGGLRTADVREVVAELPYLGFHLFLARGLTGHAVTHPRRPLPMMRW